MRYQAGSYSTGRQGLDNVTMEKRNWDGSIRPTQFPGQEPTTFSISSKHQCLPGWQLTV